MLCPWRDACRSHADGSAESLPARLAKAARPLRRGVAFWIERGDGAVLLRRRPESGLLGGMMEVPSTEWRTAPWRAGEAQTQAPFRARWRRLPDVVRHVFTHFELELAVLAARVTDGAGADGIWVDPSRLGDHALPSVMKKVIAHARRGGR
jgi:A/G-specific adenine glycosylase